MSNTPNARKAAARRYQREHPGTPYPEALRQVTSNTVMHVPATGRLVDIHMWTIRDGWTSRAQAFRDETGRTFALLTMPTATQSCGVSIRQGDYLCGDGDNAPRLGRVMAALQVDIPEDVLRHRVAVLRR